MGDKSKLHLVSYQWEHMCVPKDTMHTTKDRQTDRKTDRQTDRQTDRPKNNVGRSSQANFLERNSAMDDSIGGS